MELNINKYANIVIYKIVCNDLNVADVYVGSTINLRSRKFKHKHSCNDANNKCYNQQKYVIIRNNGGWDNWSIIEIEKFPCNDSNEARARERYWYEMLNASMNLRKPLRELIEKIEYQTDYYKKNKEEIKIRRKLNLQTDEAKKKNRENVKQYYRKNKEMILDKRRSNVTHCNCCSVYQTRDKSQHLKTKKHIQFIDSLNLSIQHNLL